MLQLCDRAHAKGLSLLFTSVIDGNTAASRFCERRGFAFRASILEGEAEMCLHIQAGVVHFVDQRVQWRALACPGILPALMLFFTGQCQLGHQIPDFR